MRPLYTVASPSGSVDFPDIIEADEHARAYARIWPECEITLTHLPSGDRSYYRTPASA